VFVSCGEDSQVGPSERKRDPKALTFSCNDIGFELSGRCQNSIGDRFVKSNNHHPSHLMDFLPDPLQILNDAKEVGTLNHNGVHSFIEEIRKHFLIRPAISFSVRDQDNFLLIGVNIGLDDLPIFRVNGL
jgi:hypothetical protein